MIIGYNILLMLGYKDVDSDNLSLFLIYNNNILNLRTIKYV